MVKTITTRPTEDARREKRRAPSEQKAQAVHAVLQGQLEGQGGEELLSSLGRLSTERVRQEGWEEEQAQALGRGRYEPRGEKLGDGNGSEAGTLKRAAGVFRVPVPQIGGREEPYRSAWWSAVAKTSDVLKRLMVER